MGLRDRIAGEEAGRRANGDGDGDGVSYYRKRLLEEVNLSEIAELSAPQRRARLERVVGRITASSPAMRSRRPISREAPRTSWRSGPSP